MTTTTIKSVHISNLFEMFDYEVKYPEGENVLIITGPNGFGKTQILNILYNLFNRKLLFFHNLVFKKITVFLDNNISIDISKRVLKSKKGREAKNEVIFVFKEGINKIETLNYSANLDIELQREIERFLPVAKIDDNRWVDHTTNELLTTDDVVYKFESRLPKDISRKFLNIRTEKADAILDSVKVHLIREQRLFKKINSMDPNNYGRVEKEQTVMIETIQTYSTELRDEITNLTQQSFTISQSLDSSYPQRLISEKDRVSKEEYDGKFESLMKKQERLKKNGLYDNTQEALEYSKDDAKALLIYLNDLTRKLEVFDDVLEKLELFTNILNERRFTYKSIKIDRQKGFYFETVKGKALKLSQLSSGEQHEVVLLYELIFKTKQGILVLIDEPEISLHVTWQKEFLDDLLRIIKIQKFQVLIATHSPSIINDRWDLVYNLEDR